MSMKLAKYLSLLILTTLLFGACTKNKLQKTNVQLLCSRLWSCTSVTDNGVASTVDCMYADELTFDLSGKGNRHFKIKCATTDPENLVLRWNLSTDGKTLSISNFEDDVNRTTQMNVLTLSNTSLEVEYANKAGHTIKAAYVAM